MTRESYYGYFTDHHSNGGIFYNLDDAQNGTSKLKYKKEFVYNGLEELYEFFEILGEGSFSIVYRAKFLPTQELIAVKVSKISKKFLMFVCIDYQTRKRYEFDI